MAHDTTSLTGWLDTLAAAAPMTRLTESLRDALARNPSAASYASISEVSRLAGLNVAAVTRTAQSWGFTGWPALRVELRGRYLESLSLTRVASERRGSPVSDRVGASLDADRRALLATASTVDPDEVRAVADVAAGAQRRVALGDGSYKSLADLAATYFTLAGYPTSSPGDIGEIAASISPLAPGDLVIGFDLWRGYATTREALTLAHEHGATVCLVTDRGGRSRDGVVDHLFHVSSESSAFFPTLVPAVALVNAIATELAAVDPAATDRSTQRFERLWRRLGSDGPPTPSPTLQEAP